MSRPTSEPAASLPAVVLGEVALDRDGVLHGWCWDPARPSARLILDVLVDNIAVARVTASRFREDVRNRKFGDGYHGFTLPLTKQLSRVPAPKVIGARESDTGRVFWQINLGRDVLPAGFYDRLDVIAGDIRLAAGSAGLAPSRWLRTIASALDGTGRHLNARAAGNADAYAQIDVPDTQLTFEHRPRATLILSAGPDAGRIGTQISQSARMITAMGAELILCDTGADPRCVLLATRIGNLRYVYVAGTDSGGRNAAAQDARSETLIFLSHFSHGFPDAGTFAIAREKFLAAGGFDERLEGDAAIADLRLRVFPDAAGPDHFLGVHDGF